MIEEIVREHLKTILDVPVLMEEEKYLDRKDWRKRSGLY